MIARRVLAAALAALVLSLTPAYADVVNINPDEPPPPSLDPQEQERLSNLLNYASSRLISAVSPDEAVVLAQSVRGDEAALSLVSVEDGAETPVDPLALELFAYTEYRWRDPQSLVTLTFSGEDGFTPTVVTIGRGGEVTTATVELPGYPYSLAPDGYTALVEIMPPEEDEPERMRSSFDLRVRTGLPVRERAGGVARRDADDVRAFASEDVTLGVVDLRTGVTREVLTLPAGSELEALSWSRDSRRLALVRNNLNEADNEELQEFILSNRTTQDALGQLAPAENPFLQRNVVSMFDIGGEAVTPLGEIRPAASGQDIIANVAWGTDGQTLAAQMMRPARIAGRPHPTYFRPAGTYLNFYDAGGAYLSSFDAPELSAPESRLDSGMHFATPDELFLTAPVSDMSFRAYYYNRVSGEFRALPIPAGTVSSLAVAEGSRRVIYGFSSFTEAPDLYRINWDGTAIRRLTFANAALAERLPLRADRVSFRLAGGQRRDGFLIQRAEAAFPPRNVPIVAWQEGGPGGTMTNQWAAEVEAPFALLPHFGVAVLVTPLPGREGYGPGFLNALADRENFGRIDIDEQAEIMRQVLARGWSSPGRIGITGCSYGGYFTTQSIVRHPRLYAAANAQCSWVEMVHDWHYIGAPLNAYLTGETPMSDPAEYTRDSPLYNAGQIRTPLLIFHGTEDFQPIRFMQTLHDQLAQNRVPTRLIQFEGEGHGLDFAASQQVAAEAQIEWFRQYLR